MSCSRGLLILCFLQVVTLSNPQGVPRQVQQSAADTSACQISAVHMAVGPDVYGGPEMLPHTSEYTSGFVLSCPNSIEGLHASNFRVTPKGPAFSSPATVAPPVKLPPTPLGFSHYMVSVTLARDYYGRARICVGRNGGTEQCLSWNKTPFIPIKTAGFWYA